MQKYHYEVNSLFDELEGMSILCQGYRFWIVHETLEKKLVSNNIAILSKAIDDIHSLFQGR